MPPDQARNQGRRDRHQTGKDPEHTVLPAHTLQGHKLKAHGTRDNAHDGIEAPQRSGWIGLAPGATA